MHAISSYCGNRPTRDTPVNKQTGPITIHRAAASAHCNNKLRLKFDRSMYNRQQRSVILCFDVLDMI